jgi:flagellar biogenesis protein FliO
VYFARGPRPWSFTTTTTTTTTTTAAAAAAAAAALTSLQHLRLILLFFTVLALGLQRKIGKVPGELMM